jgi:hypothetical protein
MDSKAGEALDSNASPKNLQQTDYSDCRKVMSWFFCVVLRLR